jgi:hypothetical protein
VLPNELAHTEAGAGVIVALFKGITVMVAEDVTMQPAKVTVTV